MPLSCRSGTRPSVEPEPPPNAYPISGVAPVTGGHRSVRVSRAVEEPCDRRELAKDPVRRLAIRGDARGEPGNVSLTWRYYGISAASAENLGRRYIRAKGSGGRMGVGRLVDHAVVTGSRGSVDLPRPLLRRADQRRGR